MQANTKHFMVDCLRGRKRGNVLGGEGEKSNKNILNQAPGSEVLMKEHREGKKRDK